MWEALLNNGTPWALAAALVAVHSWYLTRPVVRLWRACEEDKKVLREEHTEMRAEIVRLTGRVTDLENGGGS